MSSFTVPSFFIGSLLLPYAILVFLRFFVPKTSLYYQYCNEFLCTFLWLLWCFELQVIYRYVISELAAVVIMFVLLAVQPSVYDGALGNPCVLFVEYLLGRVKVNVALRLFLVQLLAIPFTLATVYYMWFIMSPYSIGHSDMLQYGRGSFLFSSIPVGVACEAFVTFIAFVVIRLMGPGVPRDVVSALYFTGIGRIIGPVTGAFYNPLPITAFSFFFYSQTWAELAVVYWCGSTLGACLSYIALFKDFGKSTKLS